MHSVQGAAASAMHRAMVNNPEATAKVMSAGLRHAANTATSNSSSASRIGAGGTAPGAGTSHNDVSSVAGRVAAASLAFSSRNSQPPPPSSGPPPIAEKPTSTQYLHSVKKFGDVDTSSAKNFFGSLRNSSKPASPPQVTSPPAFAGRENNFGPPPVRRVASSATPAPAAAHAPPPPPPVPRRQPTPEPEEEEVDGEWAEVLYDYDSGEAGDLKITEGERLLVTERTSDDWWTGEVGGRKGLFPASYVKVL